MMSIAKIILIHIKYAKKIIFYFKIDTVIWNHQGL
jgi:hypothetical protein